jgi:hypothetical protein
MGTLNPCRGMPKTRKKSRRKTIKRKIMENNLSNGKKVLGILEEICQEFMKESEPSQYDLECLSWSLVDSDARKEFKEFLAKTIKERKKAIVDFHSEDNCR